MNSSVQKFFGILLCVLLYSATCQAADEEFPYRSVYLKVPVIELADLYTKLANAEIIDVRSHYEYETLHIKEAQNIPLHDAAFSDKISNLRASSAKMIVFYCNGHTCKKSYDAALKAIESGISDVYAFDAGIFSWTKAHPDQATLLGVSPVDTKRLISKEMFEAHQLAPNDFASKANDGGLVIDIRDPLEKEALSLFPMVEYSVQLDNTKLKTYVDRAKRENKTLLVYDNVGKQVRWLQYFLEEQGLKDYYFLQGGAKAFFGY